MPITGKTHLIGLIGWPVAQSHSPAMHNAAAAALGLDWAYVPLPVRPEALVPALGGLAALGFRGVNVTVPHKEAVLPYLDAVYPVVEIIGAANTLVVTEGQLTGFNTDWSGFLSDLEERGVALDGRDCLVLGAGGSARAAAYALLRAGGRVTVLSRRPEQAAEIVASFAEALPGAPLRAGELSAAAEAAAAAWQPVIVNATPLGMAGANAGLSPWPDGAPLPRGAFVYDLVYNPPLTPLLAAAEAAGLPCANGLGMLVNQAAEAFELWTHRRPDRQVMRAAVE